MKLDHAAPDVRAPLASDLKATARDLTLGMDIVEEGLKSELRDQVRGAGLGERLAKTWQGRRYPTGQESFDPSAYVWSKAPKLIDAYARGATIVPVNGAKFLAIPTDDVPKKRQGNRLTPAEVEQRFGKPLIFISPSDKGFHTSSFRHAGVAFLVLKGLVVRRASSRYRNATARELEKGRQGLKSVNSVIMFVLVPSVRVTKRLDPDGAVGRWAAKFPELV